MGSKPNLDGVRDLLATPQCFVADLLNEVERAALSGEPEEVLGLVAEYRRKLNFATPKDI